MPAGRKPYQPNEKDRRIVDVMAMGGILQSDIASVIGISPKTLRKYYRIELDTAATRADAQVVGTLLKMATSGESPAATIFMDEKPSRLEGKQTAGTRRPWRTSIAVDRRIARVTQLRRTKAR